MVLTIATLPAGRAGVNYAITGEATFNLLSVSELIGAFGRGTQEDNNTPINSNGDSSYWSGVKDRFTNGPKDVGLFELHITEEGSYGKFGQAGSKIELGQIMNSIEGMSETLGIARFKLGG